MIVASTSGQTSACSRRYSSRCSGRSPMTMPRRRTPAAPPPPCALNFGRHVIPLVREEVAKRDAERATRQAS